MAKLKYDRGINLDLAGREFATVPDDEIWKVTGTPMNKVAINGKYTSSISENIAPFGYILGGCYDRRK